MKRKMPKKDVLASTADYFENQGLVLAALAAKSINVPQKAALYREAAHYFECAARMRGTPVLSLSLKKQKTLYRSQSVQARTTRKKAT